MKHAINQNGFTLIEIIIAVGLLAFATLISAASSLQLFREQQKIQSYEEQMSYANDIERQFTNPQNCKAILEKYIPSYSATSAGKTEVAQKLISLSNSENTESIYEIPVDPENISVIRDTASASTAIPIVTTPGASQTISAGAGGAINGGAGTVTTKKSLGFSYGGKKISNQRMSVFNITPIDGLDARGIGYLDVKPMPYKILEAHFFYTVGEEDISKITEKPISIYITIDEKGYMTECSSRALPSVGVMNRFCQSLGVDYRIGFDNDKRDINGNASMKCMVPAYNVPATQLFDVSGGGSFQEPRADYAFGTRQVKPTQYISLNESLCEFGKRGFKGMNRYCIQAAQ
jgi:prepilin-type N-terminal cleavage/methylation domain-containing protein